MANDELKPIRTYQRDVEELMRNTQVSKADIALAEGEKRRRESETLLGGTPPAAKIFTISQTIPLGGAPRRPKFNWRLVALAGGALLVIAGAGLAWRYISTKIFEPTEVSDTLPAAQKGGADIVLQGGESRAGFIRAVREKVATTQTPLNELRTLSIRIAERAVTTEELLAFLESRAPAPLIRALDETPTVGVHGIRGNQLFLLFKVDSFDHGFDGMLAWERTLLDDVGPLFGVTPKEPLSEPATTTTDVLQRRLTIKDAIIRNKDVRAVFDKGGRILFLYSFLDKETLLMATSEETLKVVLPKVSRGRLR